MALNIKDPEVERLVAEVVGMTGETKTEAVRRALAERQVRLRMATRAAARDERLRRFLEREVWGRVPRDQWGCMPDRTERKRILGYGPRGV